ncbi:MAG: hypothetical protein MZV63_29370 [Marinilabiliales bacterium]|nr:hypothetical protein [Marinilabiliales bacterium]
MTVRLWRWSRRWLCCDATASLNTAPRTSYYDGAIELPRSSCTVRRHNRHVITAALAAAIV